MSVDPANAHELAQIASEIGADVLSVDLRYPSETGGWQLGELVLRGSSIATATCARWSLSLRSDRLTRKAILVAFEASQ